MQPHATILPGMMPYMAMAKASQCKYDMLFQVLTGGCWSGKKKRSEKEKSGCVRNEIGGCVAHALRVQVALLRLNLLS